ncbi:MAG: RloB domain-containing protein [Pirellulales bacterium]|nr:RloB domain-containing protein [Pirellulales bacterium]
MNLRHKKPRPLTREEKPFRDARLFVIATEDTHSPAQYFKLFRNTRINVKILPTADGLSSPEHVLKRLETYRKEIGPQEGDELWLVLDTDHWVEPNHIANFVQVCSQAVQKGFQLAHSNPCFEVWLLLHQTDLHSSEQFQRCAEVIQRLKTILDGYNKRGTVKGEWFPPESITLAIERAETLDSTPDDRWPQKTGSHVYKLVKSLRQFSKGIAEDTNP